MQKKIYNVFRDPWKKVTTSLLIQHRLQIDKYFYVFKLLTVLMHDINQLKRLNFHILRYFIILLRFWNILIEHLSVFKTFRKTSPPPC